jgi:hypothetical protein
MTINIAESIPATVPATRLPGSRNQRTIFVESLLGEDAEKVKAKAIVETAVPWPSRLQPLEVAFEQLRRDRDLVPARAVEAIYARTVSKTV